MKPVEIESLEKAIEEIFETTDSDQAKFID